MNVEVQKQRVRVGVFIVVALAVLIGLIFLLGKSQSIFARKATLYASFENIGGLVVGAPVRLAGLDIGIVEQIRFDPDPGVKRVNVTLGVERQYLERIREDSMAQMTTKGLLGDMIINITLGSADSRPLADGATIKSRESEGLAQVISAVESAISNVKHLTGEIDDRLQLLLTEQLAKDVGRIAHSTANVIEKVEKGDGLTHAIIYDEKMTRDARAILADAQQVAGHVDSAVARLERMIAEVETGSGLLHGLVYDKSGAKTAAELTRLASELADIVAEIKTGRGMLHSLVYEDDKTNLIQNLSAAAKIVREVAQDVQAGKGTVGGLLRDPTIYQDLKTVLGNLKRNVLLKALVRFTIEKDGLKRTGKITEIEPASAPAQE